MKYIKVFLYTIFLTVLFFIAENVNADTYGTKWIREKWVNHYNNFNYTGSLGTRGNYYTGFTSQSSGTLYYIQFAPAEKLTISSPDKINHFYFYVLLAHSFDFSGIQNETSFSGLLTLSSASVTLTGNGYNVACEVNNNLASGPIYVSCPYVENMATSPIDYVTLSWYGSGLYTFGISDLLTLQYTVNDNQAGFNSVTNSINDASTKAHNDSVNEQAAMNKNTQAVNDASTKAHNDSVNEQNAMNKNTTAVNDQTNTIKDSNVDIDGSFFSGFDNNTHGLTGIVTAPLQLIGSITSSKCTPLGLPIPFVNQTVELPCMSTIYTKYFGEFFSLYQTITFGMISYWVCVNIMFMVKGFKDPDSDRIEVLDL